MRTDICNFADLFCAQTARLHTKESNVKSIIGSQTKLIQLFKFTISIEMIVPSLFFPQRLAEGLHWNIHSIFYCSWKFPCVRSVSYNDSSLFLVLYGPSTPIAIKEEVSGLPHRRWTTQPNHILLLCP